jgi:hypothetical protein
MLTTTMVTVVPTALSVKHGNFSCVCVTAAMFTGPFPGTFLSGYAEARRDSGEWPSYQSLAAAQTAALALPAAHGITMEREHVFTVRTGSSLRSSPLGERSWLKLGSVTSHSLQYLHKHAQPVRISGVSGGNAKRIMGLYEPTEELYNNRVLYAKVGDPNAWLRYAGSNGKWILSPTSNKDANDNRGWAFSHDKDTLFPQHVRSWIVATEKAKNQIQSSMVVTVRGSAVQCVALELSLMRPSCAFCS